MRKLVTLLLSVMAGLAGPVLASTAPALAASTNGSDPQSGRIVSESAWALSPNIQDGTVYSITQVGDLVVVGGSFTKVRDYRSNVDIPRQGVFAFSASTGKVSTTFAPQPNGTVDKVLPAADGTSVYVAGGFTTAAGAKAKNLFRARVSDGSLVPGFSSPGFDGDIKDLELTGNRLWVAGRFAMVGSHPQTALATVDATTGAYDPYFDGVVAGLHNGHVGAKTSMLQISTNPSNTRLVGVGNFTSVDGASRAQIVQLDISGGAGYALSGWSTTLFTSPCSAKFETNMADVEYAPDGSYFVVSTTGGYGGYQPTMNANSGCDGVFRFEGGVSTVARPTWTAYTGGDTTWTVEVTDGVIYAGGHQRWQNNPTAADAAGQGAVARTGIAALDPVNGMPWSWNPTRTRGVGVQDMMATRDGLWVGSDTTSIASSYHARIALLPLAGGKALPVVKPVTLPADVYTVATTGSQLVRRSFDGSTADAPTSGPAGASAPAWGSVVGAFTVNDVLYTATSDGTLRQQTFDGSTYGPSSVVSTADQIVPQTDWHSGDVPKLTSLFYLNGRIYFTLSGQSNLYYRGFEAEDGVVGQQRFASGGIGGVPLASLRGAFVAGGSMYYASSTGQLFKADWGGNAPVPNTSAQVTGAGSGWASRAMFPFASTGASPAPVDAAPTAAATVSCTGLTCSFDASASRDSDGTIASYDWDFGDHATASSRSAATTHDYAAAGGYTATLTVTDDQGATATTTVTATPTATAPANGAPTARIAAPTCSGLACSFDGTGSTDPDQDALTYRWDFGDATTSSEAAPQHAYQAGGARTVRLTVTDTHGATGTATVSVSPSASTPPAAAVSFVGATTTDGNRTSHTVTVPGSVQAGDALVVVLTSNNANASYSSPAGWTQLQARDDGSILTRVWSRVATASDAGSAVKVTSSALGKSEMTVAAYRGTDPASPVAGSAVQLASGSTAGHATPTLTAGDDRGWLVSYWADKTAATTSWTEPAGQTVRTTMAGSSSGHISSLLTDPAGPVGPGTVGGLTATARSATGASASSHAVGISILLH